MKIEDSRASIRSSGIILALRQNVYLREAFITRKE
ncbi:hypothetical protein KSS87_011512, partial [Heliosperma pusillum]